MKQGQRKGGEPASPESTDVMAQFQRELKPANDGESLEEINDFLGSIGQQAEEAQQQEQEQQPPDIEEEQEIVQVVALGGCGCW